MSKLRPFVAVVDDDESVSRAIRRLLRSAGLDSDAYRSGEAFLDAFACAPATRPDCLVLDVQMPGMNGLEVQKRLAGSGVAVIFITAHDETGVREEAIAGGARAYLCKPVSDEALIGAVRAAITPA
jgi:FixJ family two-component response regulator